MPTDRWHRLEQLFAEAVAQPAGVRADFLARACGADAGTAGRDRVAADGGGAVGRLSLARRRSTSSRGRSPARAGASSPAIAIGSYTVERRLGAGGMGEVWRARDERLGRDVAIKLLLPHPSNAAERVRAFQHEARAAGTLNHTNVLTVYDVGDHDGAPYLVTECLEGESLRARLGARRRCRWTRRSTSRSRSREGSAPRTQRGIVHRDLKPENIFLARGRPREDPRFRPRDAARRAAARRRRTSPAGIARSLVAGTAGYMAPEQVRGEAVDRRADIFALGAVLYEMLAGRRPFKADSTLGTLDAS